MNIHEYIHDLVNWDVSFDEIKVKLGLTSDEFERLAFKKPVRLSYPQQIKLIKLWGAHYYSNNYGEKAA